MKTLEVRKTSLPIFWALYAALYATLIWGWVSMAHAATPPSATVSFSAPTSYTDVTPIAAGTAISYTVFMGLRGQPKTTIASIVTTSTTVTAGLTPGNTYCFEVSATVAGQESAHSNEVCKTFALPVPNAVVITVL